MKALMTLIPPAWRTALPLLLIALMAVLWLYRDTGLAMVEIWDRSETFAHAFVVPPISLWLIWRQRAVLALQSPQPAPVFLLPIAAMALLWLLGDLAAVNSATQLALTAMLVLIVPATLGWPTARCIAFPLGFLFFAVPIGEFMMPQLMVWTAEFTIAALRFSGIPVYREGLQFIIPSGSWSVVEACSGIRYLMASMMVGTLFAYLNYRSLKRRWIFVGVAIVLPLVANWVRAYLIVMLGHLSGNQLATGADHLVYGWVFFGIIMLVMFMIGAKWAEPDAQTPVAAVTPAGQMPNGHFPAARSLLLLTGLLLLLAAPLWWLQSTSQPEPAGALRLVVPDLASGGWQQLTEPPRLKPSFNQPAAELQTSYQKPGAAAVGLYVAYYRQQSYTSKLISSNNVLVRSDDKAWSQVSGGTTTVLASGQSLPLRTAELSGAALAGEQGGNRLRVWQLYWINGRPLNSDWQAKIYGAVLRLLGRGDDAAVVVVYVDKAAAGPNDQALAEFMRDNWSAVDAGLKSVRDADKKSVSSQKNQ
jgi:exosortase A